MLCSLYRMNRGGKLETEITNYLTNLIFTRGMITTNSLNCTYNSSSWKVLQEVQFGLLIIELYVRGSGVKKRRRRRCPETKRVPGQNGFTFRCHDATNVRNKEKERERETIRKAPTRYNITNIETWRYVCMKMHEHVTCKYKCIMSLA